MVASPTAAMTTRPPLPLAPTPVSTPFFEERLFEERTVELEWPESIRLGDSDLIRLTFSPRPEGGLTPTVEFEGHRVEPEALTIPDLSATHYTFAIARLDAAGFDVQPGGTQERELMLGQPLTYRWTLKARDAGQHRVALSLTLRWEPKAGVNERVRTATVWDRALEIQVRTALGLSGPMSDWLGVGGSTLGTVLGLPFLETILTGLWKRWRRRGA
jgi:predicted secreted protein